jgi:glycosyltransferase involved in cell wall biosynthesis
MQNIYYFAYPKPTTGGDFVNIEHVLSLQDMGFPVSMLYPGENSDVAMTHLPENSKAVHAIAFTPDDYFVIPENDLGIIDFARDLPCNIVIHNQNTFYLLNAMGPLNELNCKRFGSMICPSIGNAAATFDAGYQGAISVIAPGVPKYFAPTKKILKIAFSPRKLPVESNAVAALFRSMYPQYSDIEWQPILNMEREEVARVLGECAIYAAFSDLEAISLSVLEAMRSGCIVVGDHGGAGYDYATPSNGLWVRANNTAEYARAIAHAIALFKAHGENSSISIESVATAEKYDIDNFRQNLRAFWDARANTNRPGSVAIQPWWASSAGS